MDTAEEIIQIIYLAEMILPRKKLGRSEEEGIDLSVVRKLKKQEKMELKFIAMFFDILEKTVPDNDRIVDKFIDRYYRYIKNDTTSPPDINLSIIFDFIYRLGKEPEYLKVARVIGLVRGRNPLTKRDIYFIEELKNTLKIQFLDRVKRIMRGTSSDATHAGVSHPVNIKERFDKMRVKNIMAKWHLRGVKRLNRELSDIQI